MEPITAAIDGPRFVWALPGNVAGLDDVVAGAAPVMLDLKMDVAVVTGSAPAVKDPGVVSPWPGSDGLLPPPPPPPPLGRVRPGIVTVTMPGPKLEPALGVVTPRELNGCGADAAGNCVRTVVMSKGLFGAGAGST